ncbi:MAG: DNA-processing protein DprA [Geminicoccaceae bacterium]
MNDRLTLTERLDWLQLARSGGVGPKTFYRLLHRFGNARRALAALPRLSRDAGGAERPICPRDEAEAELDRLQAMGCHLIAHGEADYPELLGQIHDPPPLLTVRGDLSALCAPAVAIVGARNASANGRLLARSLAKDLVADGLVLVSGLARGIDTAAHEGAIDGHGRTVAVIASGVDIAYPADNADLMARIAETGAVISERPLGSAPQARHFPRRNRLISGLSRGIVVVEAAPKSGSLITARMAGEQGRDVMAVPGSPLDPRHRGTNQLLRDGAGLVETAEDVKACLNVTGLKHTPGSLLTKPGQQENGFRRESEVKPCTGGGVSLLPNLSAPTILAPSPSGETLVSRVCEKLGTEPLLVDELIRQCHANSAEMQHTLLELELDGRIQRHPGNRVSLASS